MRLDHSTFTFHPKGGEQSDTKFSLSFFIQLIFKGISMTNPCHTTSLKINAVEAIKGLGASSSGLAVVLVARLEAIDN